MDQQSLKKQDNLNQIDHQQKLEPLSLKEIGGSQLLQANITFDKDSISGIQEDNSFILRDKDHVQYKSPEGFKRKKSRRNKDSQKQLMDSIINGSSSTPPGTAAFNPGGSLQGVFSQDRNNQQKLPPL